MTSTRYFVCDRSVGSLVAWVFGRLGLWSPGLLLDAPSFVVEERHGSPALELLGAAHPGHSASWASHPGHSASWALAILATGILALGILEAAASPRSTARSRSARALSPILPTRGCRGLGTTGSLGP